MGSFQQGQRVKFLNDVGSATVVRVEGELVVVEDEDGFERTVGIRELMAAPTRNKRRRATATTSRIWPSCWCRRWARSACAACKRNSR